METRIAENAAVLNRTIEGGSLMDKMPEWKEKKFAKTVADLTAWCKGAHVGALFIPSDEAAILLEWINSRAAATPEPPVIAALRYHFPQFAGGEPVTPEAIAKIADMIENWAPVPTEIPFYDQDEIKRVIVRVDSNGIEDTDWVIPHDARWIVSQKSPAEST